MILTRENLAHYLLDRGLLRLGNIPQAGTRIVEEPRKNRNFVVTVAGRPGYFIKQARYWEPHAAASVAVEARCLQAFEEREALAPLRPLTPRLVAHDPRRAALVVTLAEGAGSLSQTAPDAGFLHPTVADQLGRALATLHGSASASVVADLGLSAEAPWILSAPAHDGNSAGARSAAGHELFDVVRRHGEFEAGLAHLRAAWRPEVLVHGDLKWENCLLAAHTEPPRLWLVDWELAALGAGWWDVGGILQAYLFHWLRARTPETGDTELAKVQAAARAFWSAYRDHLPNGTLHWPVELAVAGAAGRLIQTALEASARHDRLSDLARTTLQLAANLLGAPRQGSATVLGLEPETSPAAGPA